MLWQGFGLWQEHFGRGSAEGEAGSGQKPGEHVTEGDQEAFAEFMADKKTEKSGA